MFWETPYCHRGKGVAHTVSGIIITLTLGTAVPPE